jgi:hypothetical protein
MMFNDGYIMVNNGEYLVGGDWNHGILNDFPSGMECHHPK